MNIPTRILHLEDDPNDVILIAHTLKKAGLHPILQHADTRQEYIHALQNFNPDIILSDHSLGQFNSHEALQLAQQLKPGLPFILVSGMASEKLVMTMFRDGAADYVLKDQLLRLPPAIVMAVNNAKAKKETAQLMLQAQERERNEIGRELHDNVNQVLAAAKLYLQSAMSQKDNRGDFLQKGHDYVVDAISEIRKISHQLVTPAMKEVTLIGAINQLIHDIRVTTSLHIEFNTSQYKSGLINEEYKLMLYRIIQEQMNNIIQHADAQLVSIILSSTDKRMMLTIRDDGKGFDVGQVRKGIGMRNIHHRADFLKASVKLTSSPGRGCSLALCFGLQA